MGGNEVLQILNNMEMKYNRDVRQPEMAGMNFKWKSCTNNNPIRRYGKLTKNIFNSKRFGIYFHDKYKLEYADGFEYIPRPFYSNKMDGIPKSMSKKVRGGIGSVTIPYNTIEITPPSILKLAGKPLYVQKGNYAAQVHRVTYYGGKYKVDPEPYDSIVTSYPKFINVGESKEVNRLYDALQGMTRSKMTNKMPLRKKAPYDIKKMYPNYKKYQDWVVGVVTEDFINDILFGVRSSKWKRNGGNDITEELRNEDDTSIWDESMLEHSYSPIMKQERVNDY